MMKKVWLQFLRGGLVGLMGITTTLADEVVTIRVRGEGISEDAARLDALRKALAQGGRQEISSRSQVENFELIRDTIYARADGIVSDYKIIDKGVGLGGVHFCEIEARVSKSAIAGNWGEVQNVLDQLGRPTIIVSVVETIDGVPDASSILENKLEEMLIESGFDVRAGAQVRAIMGKEIEDAQAEDNVARMRAIAKNFGAQIFITGHAHANQAGITEAGGTTLAMYNVDCALKMYYTDTGKMLAAQSLPHGRGGARSVYSFSPQAAKKALSNAGEFVVENIYEACLREWATQISAGGAIELQIAGLKLGTAIKLKKELQEIRGILSVDYSMSKGVATYRIVATLTAETLAEHLVEGDWAALIEIVDLQMNRIQAEVQE
jgi:hypothetical protein